MQDTEKTDPKYIGVPNICLSVLTKDDPRETLAKQQRLERGFDDSETWNLQYTIASFILPRLKRYREKIDGFIGDTNDLYKNVDLSIMAFEITKKYDDDVSITESEWSEYQEGITAFSKVFWRLWW